MGKHGPILRPSGIISVKGGPLHVEETADSWENAGIDGAILPLIKDLNYHGYMTQSCCQGGRGHETPMGWINFSDHLSKDELEDIKQIVRSYTDTPFVLRSPRGEGSTLTFLGPLGRPSLTTRTLRRYVSEGGDWEAPAGFLLSLEEG